MTTLSVPLTDDMRAHIKLLVTQGVAPSDAALAREAIQKYLEDQAVQAVLQAQKEPSLKGDLDALASRL